MTSSRSMVALARRARTAERSRHGLWEAACDPGLAPQAATDALAVGEVPASKARPVHFVGHEVEPWLPDDDAGRVHHLQREAPPAGQMLAMKHRGIVHFPGGSGSHPHASLRLTAGRQGRCARPETVVVGAGPIDDWGRTVGGVRGSTGSPQQGPDRTDRVAEKPVRLETPGTVRLGTGPQAQER